MQQVYMRSYGHVEVFTTVLAPRGLAARSRYRVEAEKMVVTHNYKPSWPDELALARGDVILVLSKHEEGRWVGRRRDGQQGFFPASCVMELGQATATSGDEWRSLYLRSSNWGSASGARMRWGRPGQGERRGPFLEMKPQKSTVPVAPAPQASAHGSLGLLHKILAMCRKKTQCQGTTNGAFEAD